MTAFRIRNGILLVFLITATERVKSFSFASIGKSRAFVSQKRLAPSSSASFLFPSAHPPSSSLSSSAALKSVSVDRESSDDEEDRELIRVRRRKRRRDPRDFYDDDEEQADYYDDNDDEGSQQFEGSSVFDEDYYYDEDDDDDEDWDEVEDVDVSDLFEDVIIPNPLLDSIDPDGAADRFPELARDPRFWFDIVFFLAVLNFLSFIGPRDSFPDIPWY